MIVTDAHTHIYIYTHTPLKIRSHMLAHASRPEINMHISDNRMVLDVKQHASNPSQNDQNLK